MVNRDDFIINLGDEDKSNDSYDSESKLEDNNKDIENKVSDDLNLDDDHPETTYNNDNIGEESSEFDKSSLNSDIDNFVNQNFEEENFDSSESEENKEMDVPTINIFDSDQENIKDEDDEKMYSNEYNSKEEIDNKNDLNELETSKDSDFHLFKIADDGEEYLSVDNINNNYYKEDIDFDNETETETDSDFDSENKDGKNISEETNKDTLLDSLKNQNTFDSNKGESDGDILTNIKEKGISFDVSEDEEIEDDLEVFQSIKENKKNKKKVAFMIAGFSMFASFSFLSYLYIDFNSYIASINNVFEEKYEKYVKTEEKSKESLKKLNSSNLNSDISLQKFDNLLDKKYKSYSEDIQQGFNLVLNSQQEKSLKTSENTPNNKQIKEESTKKLAAKKQNTDNLEPLEESTKDTENQQGPSKSISNSTNEIISSVNSNNRFTEEEYNNLVSFLKFIKGLPEEELRKVKKDQYTEIRNILIQEATSYKRRYNEEGLKRISFLINGIINELNISETENFDIVNYLKN